MLTKTEEMKKVILSYLVSAIALVSCSKDETSVSTSTGEISVSAIPSSIAAYINEYYPDASISTVLKYSGSDTAYAVTLNTNEFLAFNGNLSPLSGSHTELLCDSLNGHPGGGHHGGGHHGGGHNGGGIPADSLPAAITDYIATNYAGYSAHHAWYDTLCQFGIVIDVMIDSSETEHHKLIFDASGLFLAAAHRFNKADLPAQVSAAISTSYPAYSLREKAEQYVLADGSIQYKVFLHMDTSRISVVFKVDGSVVCEQ